MTDDEHPPTAEQPAEQPAAQPAEQPPTTEQSTRPHRRSIRIGAGAVIVVLTALLGFAIVVQVRANSGSDNLANLREDDLIGILDNQNARADRLRQEIADLQQSLRRLQDSKDRSSAARHQAEQETLALGVLLGTLPATGPGVTVRITDPRHALGAEDLLDVLEELRGAGAEAIAFGSARVSTSSAFTLVDGHVALDGTVLDTPYSVVAIGDPKTLDTALNIPGGVAAAVRTVGGSLTVAERQQVTIRVTRSLPKPAYASPSGH